MSATVTGTGSTVLGWNSGKTLAKAVTTSARTTAAAATPANIGREEGRRMGRLNPKRGFAAGAALTRLNAEAPSGPRSRAGNQVAAARASSAHPADPGLPAGPPA